MVAIFRFTTAMSQLKLRMNLYSGLNHRLYSDYIPFAEIIFNRMKYENLHKRSEYQNFGKYCAGKIRKVSYKPTLIMWFQTVHPRVLAVS
jgi:hypothetical protein